MGKRHSSTSSNGRSVSRNGKTVYVRRTKKRYKGVGRFVFFCVLIIVLLVGGFVAYKYLTRDNYDSKASFAKYTNNYFDETNYHNDFGEKVENIEYEKPLSIGTILPKIDDEDISADINEYIITLKSDFNEKYSDVENDDKIALLISYSTSESSKNTKSILISSEVRKESTDGKLNIIGGNVKTFNYTEKNTIELKPILVFNAGYETKINKLVSEKLKSEYGSDLTKDYKSYITSDSGYVENYELSKDEVSFDFKAGTILPVAKGNIRLVFKNSDFKDILRDTINPRGIDPSKPMVALTFDDGPNGVYTAKLLDIFEKTDTVATFFELGTNVVNVDNADELLKREEALGCEVGSHSYDHPNLFTLSDEAVAAQNKKTDDAIEAAIGHKPVLYRPPFGNGNAEISEIFGKSGILWSVDTQDWKTRNAQSTISSIKSQSTLDGKVILMHSLYKPTVDAVDEIVPYLKENGYQLVTVSELLTYKYGEDPTSNKFYGYNFFYPSNPLDK